MKNQIQKLKTKLTGRGSILVYTLIIMMIMLSTALSIFAVAVREKKGAGTTAASTQAFAVADSGSEIALKEIANGSGNLASIGCDENNQLTGSIGSGMDYTVTFYDSSEDQLTCTASISEVDKVKSVGRYAGTARAVEVAVAQTGECSFVSVDSNDCDGSPCSWSTSAGSDIPHTVNKICQMKKGFNYYAVSWSYSGSSCSAAYPCKAWNGGSWNSETITSYKHINYIYCCPTGN